MIHITVAIIAIGVAGMIGWMFGYRDGYKVAKEDRDDSHH